MLEYLIPGASNTQFLAQICLGVRGTEHIESCASGAKDNGRHCQSPSLISVVLYTSALELILPAGR